MFDVRDPADSKQASETFGKYIDGLIAERRTMLADDFIGLLMQSDFEGQRLTDREIYSFCTLLFGAGFETTADALSVMLWYLAQHPSEFQRLKTDPGFISTAVEEFLRFASPIQIFARNAARDVDVHGNVIPQGDVVALSFGSANHDPAVFENPEQCLIDRFPNKHLAFGAGIHLCLGAPVARLELQVTLEMLVKHVNNIAISGEPIWKTRGDRRGLDQLPISLIGIR